MRELDSGALASPLAQKLGGEVFDLSAPAVADSAAAAEVLRNQRDIRLALDIASLPTLRWWAWATSTPPSPGLSRAAFSALRNWVR